MTRPAAAAALVVASLALGARAGDGAAVTVLPAVVRTDLTVSGACRMREDVTIAAGATLRLLAGTRVEIARKDASGSGSFPGTCEFLVHGRIAVDGTAAAPVVFDPETDASAGQEPVLSQSGVCWSGFSFYADRSRTPDSSFVHARIRGAGDAVKVADGEPRFESCAFDACRVGIAAGRMWNVQHAVVEECRRPRPVVVECLFVRCGTGIFTESAAAPSVTRSSFVENDLGIGNDRLSQYEYEVKGLGARADRCWFSGNQAAVEGPSVVENSVFQRNVTVFRTTDFHSTFSQSTDWIAWRRNVFFDNICITDGEADVGGDNLVADPRVTRIPVSATPFEELVLPVAGLELARDSLVRGTATDGGDPGPAGRSPPGRVRRPWGSADRALRTVLVLGPPEKVDAKRLPKTTPKAAGDRDGDAWWAAFDTDDRGGLDRSALRWQGRSDVVAAAYLWNAGDARGLMDVEVNADGTVNAWRGGAPFPFPAAELRNGSRGIRVPAPVAGPAGLVVWWKSADMDPRIAVALHLPGGARATEAAPAAPVETIVAEPMPFGAAHVGFRVKTAFHWADLRAAGVVWLKPETGPRIDLGLAGLTSFDAKGTVRADLPAGVSKAGATFVIDGLRDPWGRKLAGQPVSIDAEPVR